MAAVRALKSLDTGAKSRVRRLTVEAEHMKIIE